MIRGNGQNGPKMAVKKIYHVYTDVKWPIIFSFKMGQFCAGNQHMISNRRRNAKMAHFTLLIHINGPFRNFSSTQVHVVVLRVKMAHFWHGYGYPSIFLSQPFWAILINQDSTENLSFFLKIFIAVFSKSEGQKTFLYEH